MINIDKKIQELLKENTDLKNQVKSLKRNKKYGIVRETRKDNPTRQENVVIQCQTELPVLEEIEKKQILSDKNGVNHVLIEGDNYHSLSILSYTHKGKIDLIYADPPYNTGNKSRRYNNDYVEKDDEFKHSKWLNFMSVRLRLAKDLLKKDGVIILTIDDYELFTIGMLMDEIFGENNRIGIITVENNPRGRTTNTHFATCHEYYLIYGKNANLVSIKNPELTEEQRALFKFKDDISDYRLLPFRRSGGYSTPEERPNSFYPIYYNPKTGDITIEEKKGYDKILPIDSSGKNRVRRQTRPSLLEAIKRGDMIINKRNGKYSVMMKDRIKSGRKPKTMWIDPKFDSSSHGTVLLDSILGKRKAFDYPKSLYAVIHALNLFIGNKKDAFVLDFFAGSGTTGHAVLRLNKQDSGKRTFIICTNNEDNNNTGGGIAETVTYPRILNTIKGYKTEKGKKNEGISANLKYYKTSFVENKSTDKSRRELVKKSTDMLCLAEGTFDLVKKSNLERGIYENKEKIMAIIYDDTAIDNCVNELSKQKKPITIYQFSYNNEVNVEPYKKITVSCHTKAIPDVLLKAYQNVFKKTFKILNNR